MVSWIKYNNICEGQFPGEVIITFSTSKDELTAIFPSSSIDESQQSFIAVVIGEKGDLYLVDLPNHTFKTGSRAWFPKESVALAGG